MAGCVLHGSCLVAIALLYWSCATGSFAVAALSACTGQAAGQASSTGCSFQPTSLSTILQGSDTAHLLLQSTCQQGSFPNCSTHRYSYATVADLRLEQVEPVLLSPTNLTLNISVSSYRNRPGNFSIEVRGYDQSCRVFRFCWFLAVSALPSTAASFASQSVPTYGSFREAYSSLTEVDVVASSFPSCYSSNNLVLNTMHVTSKSNATFNLTLSLQFTEPSFSFRFVALGYTGPYGSWSDANNVSWSTAEKVFGFLTPPPDRNATHLTQTLYWAPRLEWAERRFFLTVQLRDAVNLYPDSGFHYIGLELVPRPPGPGRSSATGLVTSELCHALLLFVWMLCSCW